MSRLKMCKKISATLLLLFLVACGSIQPNITDETAKETLVWVNIGNYTEVIRVNVDGVDCVVASENNGGAVAVSCDWNSEG